MVVGSLNPPLFGVEGIGVELVADFFVENPLACVLRVGVGMTAQRFPVRIAAMRTGREQVILCGTEGLQSEHCR
jgi:hypothetical protein